MYSGYPSSVIVLIKPGRVRSASLSLKGACRIVPGPVKGSARNRGRFGGAIIRDADRAGGYTGLCRVAPVISSVPADRRGDGSHGVRAVLAAGTPSRRNKGGHEMVANPKIGEGTFFCRSRVPRTQQGASTRAGRRLYLRKTKRSGTQKGQFAMAEDCCPHAKRPRQGKFPAANASRSKK